MKNIIGILSITLLLFSCKSSEEKIKGMLSDYVKNKVRNPNTVVVYKFQVYDKPNNSKDSLFINEESKNNVITDRSDFITFLFSAKNSDGNEVFREATVYFNKNKNGFDRSYPENIDIENGYLSGTCKYFFGNLLTNWQTQNYCDGSNITIMNIDTLGGKKKYINKVQKGTYEINKIIPGNYFFKLINYNINLETVYGLYGNKKNFFLLMEIKKIMDFYQIYAGWSTYGYSDEKLFDVTLKKLEAMTGEGSPTDFYDSEVTDLWRDFKKSVNNSFLEDFEVEDDYRYLNEFDKILIEPSNQSSHNINIKNYFF